MSRDELQWTCGFASFKWNQGDNFDVYYYFIFFHLFLLVGG